VSGPVPVLVDDEDCSTWTWFKLEPVLGAFAFAPLSELSSPVFSRFSPSFPILPSIPFFTTRILTHPGKCIRSNNSRPRNPYLPLNPLPITDILLLLLPPSPLTRPRFSSSVSGCQVFVFLPFLFLFERGLGLGDGSLVRG
jgi:hypothetical protein